METLIKSEKQRGCNNAWQVEKVKIPVLCVCKIPVLYTIKFNLSRAFVQFW